MRFYWIIFTFLFTFSAYLAFAQMQLRGESLVGHEWIDYDKTYYRMDVTADGLHRVDRAILDENGVTLPEGEKWQMWFMGQEIPLYVSDERFESDDFIVFYGLKNRNGLDSLLFVDKSDQLSPRYSMITDTSCYFLTSTSEAVRRLSDDAIEPGQSGNQIDYHIRRHHIDTNDLFYKGYKASGTQRVYNSDFSDVTGWGSGRLSRYQKLFIAPDHLFTSGLQAKIGYRFSANFLSPLDTLSVILRANVEFLDTVNLASFEPFYQEYSLPLSPSGRYNTAIVRESIENNPLFIVSEIMYEYPASFNCVDNRLSYKMPTATTNVTLTNVNADIEYFIVDNGNDSYSQFIPSADTFQYTHNNADGNYHIEPINDLKTPINIKQVIFEKFNLFQNNGLTIVTSRRLYNQPYNGDNPIDEYVEYRSSEIGGAYGVNLLFIEDLYDQYSYGVRRHPMSINNLSFDIANQEDNNNLFIIGKGRAFSLTRDSETLAHPDNDSYYVPSFSFPPSDPLMISPIGEVDPRMTIGRLAISTLDEVALYLNNVKNFEQLAPLVDTEENNWKKRVIHLSGGNSQAAAVEVKLDEMTETIGQTEFNPNITTFYKNSTVAVDSSFSDEIFDLLNSGTSLVTFFGHSAPNTLGFRIDNEAKYENAPIHPLFLALGCSAGNYNIASTSVAESYCLLENAGFLNLISSTSISILQDLGITGNAFYSILGDQGDSLSVGELLNATILAIEDRKTRQAGQIQLFGDPTIRMNMHKEVDVAIEESTISTSPDFLGPDQDSFSFSFDIVNLGRLPQKPILLTVTHQFPDGTLEVVFENEIQIKQYRTSFSVPIQFDNATARGVNRMIISLDPANLIDERLYSFSESNNFYLHTDGIPGFPVFVPPNSLVALWPRNEAMLPQDDVTFYASSADLFSVGSDYYLQIDTSRLFNSVFLFEDIVTSKGGVITFDPEVDFDENLVYYWRVSPARDSILNQFYWTAPQSFLINPGVEGWNISHYYQFLDAKTEGIEINENRVWQFAQSSIPIRMGNGIWESTEQDQLGWFEYNNPFPDDRRLPWENMDEALVIMAFDHRDNQLFNEKGSNNGTIPQNKTKPFFAYENNAAGRDSLIALIDQKIPSDHTIIFFTVRRRIEDNMDASNWALDSLRNNGKNIFNLLESYGSSNIRNITSNLKAMYLSRFTKSGGFKYERISFDDDEVLIDEFTISQFGDYGIINIENDIMEREDRAILAWSFNAAVDTSDEYNIYYMLPDSNNNVYIHNNALEEEIELNTLDDRVQQTGKFFAELIESDLTNPSPAQLEKLQMYGDVIGDFAIAPNYYFRSIAERYQEGEIIDGAIGVFNVNHKETLLDYRLVCRNTQTNQVVYTTADALNVPSTQQDSVSLRIEGLSAGEYILTLELNPERQFNEASFFNNIVQFKFVVTADQIPPTLRVTFDDEIISDNQIVSPQAMIKINLTDKSIKDLLNDVSYLDVRIQKPDGSIYPIVEGLNATYSFPTDLARNTLKLEINGDFDEKGTYKLIVKGRDRSGNEFVVPYEIQFRIVMGDGFNAKIYPNPLIGTFMAIEYILLGDSDRRGYLVITNANGKTISNFSIALKKGDHTLQIPISASWLPGLYTYKFVVNRTDGSQMPTLIDETLGFGKDSREGKLIYLGGRY